MSPNSVAILTNPHPSGHIVYPYTDENLVAQAVALYSTAGLKNGEAVILVMTRAHLGPIDYRLSAVEGFNTDELQRSGHLTYVIAEKIMPAFMVNGMPDEELFKTIFGRMIERAQAVATRNEHPGLVRAFGEIVSLLWTDSVKAAEQLERYWDDLIKQYSISLLCTYALGPGYLPASLVNCHSHN